MTSGGRGPSISTERHRSAEPVRSRTRRRRSRRAMARSAVAVALTILLVALPLWLLVVNSFKDLAEAADLTLGLPEHWKIRENYGTVIHQGNAIRGLRNSLLVVVPSVGLCVVLGALAGWVFARTTLAAVKTVYYVVIAGLIVPGSIVTSVLWMQKYHLYGTRLGMIAFYVGVFLPLSIFLVAGFVKTIPLEIEEAARIDGSGRLGTFMRIVFPLLVPILATLTVLLSVAAWNDFFSPLFMLPHSDQATLPLGLYAFAASSQWQLRWNLILADVVLVSMPLVLVYLVAQRWIISGLTAGSIRG